MVVESPGSGADGLRSYPNSTPSTVTWASDTCRLCLSVRICKMGIVRGPASEGCSENQLIIVISPIVGGLSPQAPGGPGSSLGLKDELGVGNNQKERARSKQTQASVR